MVPVGALVGAGVPVGLTVGGLDGEDEGDAGADGLAVGAVGRRRRRRSGVASSDGASTDGTSVGGGVAGVPSGPDVGEQAAARSATSERTRRRLGQVVHERVRGAGSDAPPASVPSVSGASPAGNGWVTGSVSAKIRPPPGRARARRLPPISAACSAAIASPRPELPPRRGRVGLVEAVEHVRQRVARDARARGPRRRPPRRPPCGSGTPRPARRAHGPGRCRGGCPGSGRGGGDRTPRRRRRPAGRSRRAGRRDPTTADTTRPRSTGSRLGCSASASKREISISSSTSTRSRRMSATRSSAARRASGVIPAVPLSISDASPTSAVSGVRSSCETSATNRRFCCCALSSRPTVVSSVAAIRLNSAAQRPNSSCPPSGTRAVRSPPAIRSRRAGRRVDRPQDAARDEPGRDQGDEDGQQPGRHEPQAELGERRLHVGGGEHEEQVGRRPLPAADDQHRLALQRLPRVAELAARRRARGGPARAGRARRAGPRACTGCRRRSPRSCRRRRGA